MLCSKLHCQKVLRLNSFPKRLADHSHSLMFPAHVTHPALAVYLDRRCQASGSPDPVPIDCNPAHVTDTSRATEVASASLLHLVDVLPFCT